MIKHDRRRETHPNHRLQPITQLNRRQRIKPKLLERPPRRDQLTTTMPQHNRSLRTHQLQNHPPTLTHRHTRQTPRQRTNTNHTTTTTHHRPPNQPSQHPRNSPTRARARNTPKSNRAATTPDSPTQRLIKQLQTTPHRQRQHPPTRHPRHITLTQPPSQPHTLLPRPPSPPHPPPPPRTTKRRQPIQKRAFPAA